MTKKRDDKEKRLRGTLKEDENLGLDADGSSADSSVASNLNNDNDRISGNPDGEDDLNNTNERPGYSSLEDK